MPWIDLQKVHEYNEKEEQTRMKRIHFFTITFVTFCFVLTTGFASADPDDVVVSTTSKVLTTTIQTDLAPLNKAERAAAEPMPLQEIERPVYDDELRQPLSEPIRQQSVDEMVVFPSDTGRNRTKGTDATSGAVTYEDMADYGNLVDQEIELQTFPPFPAYEYPFPFTRLEVFHVNKRKGYTTFPYRTIGPLYFTIPGRGNFRCTASVAQGRWVWTTGHCVVSPPLVWHTNFTFTPGAYKGLEPYGVWSWDDMAASIVGWAHDGVICYDIGAVRFQKKKGKTLARVVGHLGLLANGSEQRHWNEFGYPAEAPFDGSRLIQSQSSIGEVDILAALVGGCGSYDPLPHGVGNDMTGGSSGGPWIVDFSGSGGASNLVNGLVSYRYIGQDLAMYGPYFGHGALNLWDFMTDNP